MSRATKRSLDAAQRASVPPIWAYDRRPTTKATRSRRTVVPNAGRFSQSRTTESAHHPLARLAQSDSRRTPRTRNGQRWRRTHQPSRIDVERIREANEHLQRQIRPSALDFLDVSGRDPGTGCELLLGEALSLAETPNVRGDVAEPSSDGRVCGHRARSTEYVASQTRSIMRILMR